jgi:hypothetical protein
MIQIECFSAFMDCAPLEMHSNSCELAKTEYAQNQNKDFGNHLAV